jgi:hypothetical protein
MKNIKNFKEYAILEYKDNQEYLFLFGLAWTILTLGQGKLVPKKLKNIFNISLYLLKAKVKKIERILSNAEEQFNYEYTTEYNKYVKIDNINSNKYEFAVHEFNGHMTQMDKYESVKQNDNLDISHFKKYVKSNFIKLIWFKDYFNIGMLVDTLKKQISTDKMLKHYIDITNNHSFDTDWKFIKTTILEPLKWNTKMTFDECKKQILKLP